MRSLVCRAGLVLGLLGILCTAVPSAATAGPGRPWTQARSWAIQLENLDLKTLAESPTDLLVIEYSRDGTAGGRFARAEVQSLQRKPGGGRRLVLAWIPVGLAARHRFYWSPEFQEGDPPWVGPQVPGWEGLFRVRFWDPEWLGALVGSPDSWVDQVIEAGFDGVVLDPADSCAFFGEQGWNTSEEDMVALIREVARHARAGSGGQDFGVFVWRAETLINNADFLRVVTGILQDGTWYGSVEPGTPTPPELTETLEAQGRLARLSGSLVLNLDYTEDPDQIRRARERAQASGFLEYAAPAGLDRLVPTP